MKYDAVCVCELQAKKINNNKKIYKEMGGFDFLDYGRGRASRRIFLSMKRGARVIHSA